VIRRSLLFAAAVALLSSPMGAQERLGSEAPDQHYQAGWTFTPTIGFTEAYDTNVSLSSEVSWPLEIAGNCLPSCADFSAAPEMSLRRGIR
jgi:hypothetical protein